MMRIDYGAPKGRDNLLFAHLLIPKSICKSSRKNERPSEDGRGILGWSEREDTSSML